MIVLDDNLDTLSNLLQYGVQVPSDFSFRHIIGLAPYLRSYDFPSLIGLGQQSQRSSLPLGFADTVNNATVRDQFRDDYTDRQDRYRESSNVLRRLQSW
jgi:hypothetical protein